MTDPRTLHGPGELIAAIPALLGFVPRESVVIVSLRAGAQIGAVMRVDRIDCLIPEVAGPLARSIAGHLSRDGAAAALLISFTSADVRVGCPALDALLPTIADAVADVESWAVRGERYFAPGCARENCCPAAGRPIPAAQQVEVARVEAASHPVGSGSPDAACDVGEPDRRKAARSAARWWARREGDPVAWRHESYAKWREAWVLAEKGARPSAPEAGKLIAALQDRRVRDAVVVSLIAGPGRIAVGVLDGGDDAQVGRALDALLSPALGRRPEGRLVRPAWEVCGYLTALARHGSRAPMLTLCALIAWWEGDEGSCRELVARAQESEPGYRLAGLLECTMLAGIAPGWKRVA